MSEKKYIACTSRLLLCNKKKHIRSLHKIMEDFFLYKNKNFACSLLIFKNKIQRPRYQFGVT